jgi:tripartite-type tricarboxylate transporter receptor subunit TctC
MRFSPFNWLRAIAATSLLASLPLAGVAQPAALQSDRPIRIVVGYPAGQTVDVIARAYALELAKELNQSVFVDNKAGANGIIGAQSVKTAAADGHTLLFGTSGQLAINPALYAKLPYSTLTDFEPVGIGSIGRSYLAVPASSPFQSLQQLLAFAKANPGKLAYGSGGIGITSHLGMELLKAAAGVDILHVPFKGSPAALTGLLGGEVQIMMDAGNLLLPQIKAGKLRALAVTSNTRFKDLPDVPTVAQQGFPRFEISTWSGLMAPAGTPASIVEKLNSAMRNAARAPGVVAALAGAGSEPRPVTAKEFSEMVKGDIEKWADAVRRAGVKPE